jgi:hypothetical protein
MAETVNIEITGYSKPELSRTIDTQFSEFVTVAPGGVESTTAPLPTVDEFFQYYQDLFFQIPKTGETNSHQYLINTSGEYVNGPTINQELLALQQEITQLRQENLELQQSLVNTQTVQ